MKEILEALSTRIRSPLFGYFVLAFVTINWEAFLNLFFSKDDISIRIEFIKGHTNYSSLIIYPAIFAVAGAVIYPWIHFLFLRLANTPTHLRNTLQINAEHVLLIEKQKLEVIRNDMQTQKEKNLIEQAMRDQEVLGIEDKELRNNLQQEIEKLRAEKDSLSSSIKVANESNDTGKPITELIEYFLAREKEAASHGNRSVADEYRKKGDDLRMQLATNALMDKSRK